MAKTAKYFSNTSIGSFMKKLLLITILFFTVSVSAQKVEVDQSFVDDAAKAFSLVVAQRDEIEKNEKQIAALEKLVEEISKSQRTPCTIAQEKVKTDLTYWFEKLSGDAAKDKVVNKILKDVRKSGRKSIAAQCNFSSQSDFMKFIDIASRLSPILLLLK